MTDILLALVIAASQGFTTWLAWQVSVYPIESFDVARKRRYSLALGLACLVSFVAASVLAFVSRQAGIDLKEIKSGVNELVLAQKSEKPAIEGGKKTGELTRKDRYSDFQVEKVESLWTRDGDMVGIRVTLKNIGNDSGRFAVYSSSGLVASTSDENKQAKIIHDLSRNGLFNRVYKSGESEVIYEIEPSEIIWFTQTSPALSIEQYDKLKIGSYAVYFTGGLFGDQMGGQVRLEKDRYCYYLTGDLTLVHECRVP